jgi:putative membrane protein
MIIETPSPPSAGGFQFDEEDEEDEEDVSDGGRRSEVAEQGSYNHLSAFSRHRPARTEPRSNNNVERATLLTGSPDKGDSQMKFATLAVLVVFAASSANAAEKPSQAFLKKAIEGNFAEVQMGQLAQQKGQNGDVKKFGQMLSDDHSAANQKAIDAAKAMGVTPPDGPNAKQKADYEKMSNMSGGKFDQQFATHMVADHQKDIAEYKKAAKQPDAAGDYAKAQIDVLQKHLDTAKSLSSRKTSNR